MKKILCALWAVVMILGLLAGCSKAEDPTDASTDPSTEATTEVTSEPTEESTGPEAETTEATDGEDVDSADGSSNSGNSSNGSSSGSSSNSGSSSKPSASGGSSSSSGSSSSGSSSGSSHTHSYNSTVVAPTCTSGGYTKHTCSCGKSYTDSETSATGHSWGGWVTTKEPTTSSEGQQTRTCSSCGATESQSIAKLPAPALDYAAAIAYGNQYGKNTYGFLIDTSLNFNNAGFYPAGSVSLSTVQSKGQSYLNRLIADKVDSLYEGLTESGGAAGAAINCDIKEDGAGGLDLYVYYG